MSTVNAKSTKGELLAAYEALREQHEQIRSQRLPARQEAERKTREVEVRQQTATASEENVEATVVDLRRKLLVSLDGTLDALRSE